MGKIQVGQKSPKTIDMGGYSTTPKANVENKGMSAEEKARIVKNIMALPKDQIVPALRKHGFNDIADITEVQMKQAEADAEAQKKADEAEKQKEAREKRLAEIQALPDDEQLPLLLEDGFTDEAQELSERLAASQQEKTDDGTGKENAGTEAPADGTTTELNDETAETAAAAEPEKKKGGRPKKTEE